MTLAKRDWDMIIQELYKERGYCLNPLLMAISAVMIPLSSGRCWRTTHLQSGNAVGERSSNNVVTSLAFKLAEMKHHGNYCG